MCSFDEMHLKDDLLRGVYGYGWETPSSIQRDGIPTILKGRDVILQAQSGVGKTGTFAISMLQSIDDQLAAIQGVIILNTRELADQVHKTISDLGKFLNYNFIRCVGKSLVRCNIRSDRPTILIGTPGKICDVLERYMIRQNYRIKILVIDEFDKTLEADFIPTIKDIFHFVGAETQVILSSATVNKEVLEITDHIMRDPTIISVKEEELTLEGISQYWIDCSRDEWKFDAILDLYRSLTVTQSIIFVNSISRCDHLMEQFKDKRFTVKAIHGRMDQFERDTVMRDFREGHIRILLSTDLTSRGIDVPGVSLVIIYDLPLEKSQYIHRVGRTGRYGKKGYAIILLGYPTDRNKLKEIEDCYRISIPELPDNFANFMK
jgi:superfamily II DNA/RNA helicase